MNRYLTTFVLLIIHGIVTDAALIKYEKTLKLVKKVCFESEILGEAMKVKSSEAVVILDKLVEAIHNNKDHLSELDGKIGDGDHGVNMDICFYYSYLLCIIYISNHYKIKYIMSNGIIMSCN